MMKREQPLEAATFSQKDFRTPSRFVQLLLSNNYLLVTNSFCNQLLLADKYFSARLLFRRSFLSGIINCSDYVPLQKRNFLRAGISQSSIVGISKQRINFYTDVLQMCLFGNLVVILVSSNKLRKIVHSNCGSKDVFFSIFYLTSIEIIFTICNFIYIVLITFAIETN